MPQHVWKDFKMCDVSLGGDFTIAGEPTGGGQKSSNKQALRSNKCSLADSNTQVRVF